jgi:uncharacterized protein YmfQ (DUF2313 family)
MAPMMVLGLAIAGCATSREAQIRTALLDVGLPDRQASCMAKDIAPKVTNQQLRNLQRATGLRREDISRMTPQEALQRLRAIDDPQLVEVAIRAGIACLISG